MHYYQKNIGDYRRDTMHLSTLEHGVYNLFLDTYYLSESPLCADHAELMRTHCLRTADEIRAAENVLKDFFDLDEKGYSHKRCDVEIEAFHGKSKSASESAKARWDRVRSERNANALNPHSDGNANHKPETNNHKPKTNKKPTAEYSAEFLEAWDEYPKRPGANKKEAFKAWSARLKAGVNASFIVDGVRRYAAYCKAQQTEPQFIKQPATFFGNGEHYLSDWTVHAQSAKNGTRNNSVQEARLECARQIMGGLSGTNRQVIDITPERPNQGDRTRIPEAINGIWESNAGEMGGD